jgi:hypothetical protein
MPEGDFGNVSWRLGQLENGLAQLAERGDKRHESNRDNFDALRRDLNTASVASTKQIEDLSREVAGQKITLTWLSRGVWTVAMLIISAVVAAGMRTILIQDLPGSRRSSEPVADATPFEREVLPRSRNVPDPEPADHPPRGAVLRPNDEREGEPQ